MPRRIRLDQLGLPQHLIQRGNNRSACFFADGDYYCHLHWLRKAAHDRGGVGDARFQAENLAAGQAKRNGGRNRKEAQVPAGQQVDLF